MQQVTFKLDHGPNRLRAAQYVRMSKEHQKYSTQNQADAIAAFAACRELTADESAYYEFVCKQAGIRVLYCAERFENDGSLCEEVHLNLAYRWVCRLGLDGEAPDLCVPKT